MSEEEKKRLSAEEILDEIHALARNGDDSNKRWALKMLSGQESSNLYLVEPLGIHEVKERGVRMMRAWGMKLTQMMWNTAFAGPNIRPTDDIEISANVDMISPEAMAYINTKMTRLRHLYILAPELKRPGSMRGCPRRGGAAAVARFVQHEAKKIIIERVRTHKDWLTGKSLGLLIAPTTAVETETVPDLGE